MKHDETEERGLLSDHIRDALSDEITTGILAAGTPLDEQELADRFGASRTPVREALRQLAYGGLVEMKPRRGVVVTRMTPERIMDMFEATAEIEAVCVRLATYRMSPIERSRIMEIHDLSARAVKSRDYGAYDGHNRDFHKLLYAATHNSILEEEASTIRHRMAVFRRNQLRFGDRLVASHREHGQILAIMAQGDGDAAARFMRAHMLNAASALDQYIREQAEG